MAKSELIMDLFEFNSITIGGRIDRLRNQYGYSIEDLAERATLNKNTVNRVIKGIGKPNLNTFLKLCEALNVTPNDLIDAAPHRNTHYRVIRRTNPDNLVFHKQEPGVRLGVLEDNLPQGSMACIVVEFEGKSSVRSHVGQELLVCTAGKIGVVLGETIVELELGDAILFHATEPHSYYNADPAHAISTGLSILSDSVLDDPDKMSVSG